MEGGFYRGNANDGSNRFTDKEKKLLREMKFEKALENEVNLRKVNLDVIKPWIVAKLSVVLGAEDDVLFEYVFSQLEDPELNPKKMQINLTGFLNARRAREFMGELWELFLEAQSAADGIPMSLVQKKIEELKAIEKRCNGLPDDAVAIDLKDTSSNWNSRYQSLTYGKYQQPKVEAEEPAEPIIRSQRRPRNNDEVGERKRDRDVGKDYRERDSDRFIDRRYDRERRDRDGDGERRRHRDVERRRDRESRHRRRSSRTPERRRHRSRTPERRRERARKSRTPERSSRRRHRRKDSRERSVKKEVKSPKPVKDSEDTFKMDIDSPAEKSTIPSPKCKTASLSSSPVEQHSLSRTPEPPEEAKTETKKTLVGKSPFKRSRISAPSNSKNELREPKSARKDFVESPAHKKGDKTTKILSNSSSSMSSDSNSHSSSDLEPKELNKGKKKNYSKDSKRRSSSYSSDSDRHRRHRDDDDDRHHRRHRDSRQVRERERRRDHNSDRHHRSRRDDSSDDDRGSRCRHRR